jgi:hypothetical protein
MYDPQALNDLFVKLQSERAALLEQARTLSEEEASRARLEATDEAGWTAKQQWAHIAESEANYRAWIGAAIREESPDLGYVRRDPVAIPFGQANDATVGALLEQLETERRKTLDVLRGLRPEQLQRVATLDLFGTLNVLQWARSFYRHDRMHVDQIAGRNPSFQPRFVDGQAHGDR